MRAAASSAMIRSFSNALSSFIFLAALTAIGGCMVIRPRSDGATDSATEDELATICRHRVEGAGGCSDACATAVATAQAGACASSVGALSSHPEITTFDGCVSGCPVARTCAGGAQLTDCVCIAACARMRSTGFQSVFRTASLCVDAQIAPDCR